MVASKLHRAAAVALSLLAGLVAYVGSMCAIAAWNATRDAGIHYRARSLPNNVLRAAFVAGSTLSTAALTHAVLRRPPRETAVVDCPACGTRVAVDESPRACPDCGTRV